MELYRMKRGEDGGIGGDELWEPFRGTYPYPTPLELRLILYHLSKFACEAHDFVESKSFISLKNRLQSPNLRHLFIKFLRQVRGSKGYDVDLYFDFIGHPYTIFVPRNLDEKKFYDEAMAAVNFAIGLINTCTMAVGKSYKVVSVDKSVSATTKDYAIVGGQSISSFTNLLLLTFTTQETIVPSNVDVVALQAMVKVCDGGFQLKEWKYKPMF